MKTTTLNEQLATHHLYKVANTIDDCRAEQQTTNKAIQRVLKARYKEIQEELYNKFLKVEIQDLTALMEVDAGTRYKIAEMLNNRYGSSQNEYPTIQDNTAFFHPTVLFLAVEHSVARKGWYDSRRNNKNETLDDTREAVMTACDLMSAIAQHFLDNTNDFNTAQRIITGVVTWISDAKSANRSEIAINQDDYEMLKGIILEEIAQSDLTIESFTGGRWNSSRTIWSNLQDNKTIGGKKRVACGRPNVDPLTQFTLQGADIKTDEGKSQIMRVWAREMLTNLK